jgi:hypothetical protein
MKCLNLFFSTIFEGIEDKSYNPESFEKKFYGLCPGVLVAFNKKTWTNNLEEEGRVLKGDIKQEEE